MQWCGEKIELLINFSSQNTFLFGVKLSDYHIRVKRAAYRSSAIINLDAINRRQFFSCQMQSARKTGARIWRRIYGAGFWSVCTRLNVTVHGAGCVEGQYGAECSQTCVCRHGARCNPVSGSCLCQPGWVGSLCQHVCPAGRYGLNCSRHCVCLNGGTCHHVTGRCQCPPGFTGSLCHTRQY